MADHKEKTSTDTSSSGVIAIESASAKNRQPKNAIPATLRMNRRNGEFALTVQLDQQSIIEAAKQVVARQFKRQSSVLDCPAKIKDFLLLQMVGFEREVFACLFLDNTHRLMTFEHLFYGSIDRSQVSVREVIKRALALNAAAVIAVHNHPSGFSKPSQQDCALTDTLQQALALSGVRLLDHFIVGGEGVVSMAECGCFTP